MDLALKNLQRLICHKTQRTKPKQSLKESLGESWWTRRRKDKIKSRFGMISL